MLHSAMPPATGEQDPDEAFRMGMMTTRAAEGLERRAFTVAEIERMQDLGVFHPDEKFELVEGEIVPMQAKSTIHEVIKETITRRLVRELPDHLWFGVERTIFLSEKTALDPDVTLFEERHKTEKVDGPRLMLVIEVSHSSLGYDRGLKAQLYARYGVPEYWVIDVKRRRTFIHTGPKEDGSWSAVRIVERDEALTISAVPGFSVTLSEF